MGSVTVRLPAVLVGLVGCAPSLEAQGATLREVLDDLVCAHPSLRVHLFDESGRIRRHVLCFHKDMYLRRDDDLGVPVAAGDTITVLQSVAGG